MDLDENGVRKKCVFIYAQKEIREFDRREKYV